MSPARLADRLDTIIRDLDWVACDLSEKGIECAEVALAASELADIKLAMEREQFAGPVAT